MTRFFVGITGASGHAYAEALLRALLGAGHEVDLAATPAGCLVLRHELGVEAGVQGELLAESLPGWLGPEAAARVHDAYAERLEQPLNFETMVQITDLKQGFYLLKIYSKNGTKTFRFFKS